MVENLYDLNTRKKGWLEKKCYNIIYYVITSFPTIFYYEVYVRSFYAVYRSMKFKPIHLKLILQHVIKKKGFMENS